MKSLFESQTLDELLKRIEKLTAETAGRWGKMDVAQMMAHCSESIDMACGKNKPKRMLIGRIFGSFFKPIFSNNMPFRKNLPTAGTLRISNKRDFEKEKSILCAKLKDFHNGGAAICTEYPHPLLGSLKPEEWGIGIYKHLDHHFRQFGV